MQPAEHPAIEKVILLLVSGIAPTDLKSACVEKLSIDEADVDAVINEARERITVAADYDRETEIGKAVTRLNDLYARALRGQDMRTALAAQRELNKLLGLYQPMEDEDTEISRQDVEDQLHQVRQHLEPLALGKADSPTVELVRLAVTEILRLRRG